MSANVLLMNDMPGYGRVALNAMMPVLTQMGCNLYNLPTALVSNTLNYGQFEILDTTEYMKSTVEVWIKLGFSFDFICTGFLVSDRQADFVEQFCTKQQANGARILVDPIMADHGKLYNGVSKQTIGYRRRLCKIADIIVPNMTEAEYLTDYMPGEENISMDQAKQMLERLWKLGCKEAVITSAMIEGQQMVCGMGANGLTFKVPYAEVPVSVPGAGDTFAALLAGGIIQGNSLQEAVEEAVQKLEHSIKEYAQEIPIFNGLPVVL